MQTDSYDTVNRIASSHWWYVGRRRIIEFLIRPFFKSSLSAKILSVGCGTGSEFEFLKKFGVVTGVDNDPKAVDYCKNAGFAASVLLADAIKLPFENANFDAVFAFDILEHVEKDHLAANELYRVLKPGGLCVVTVPAFEFLRSWSDEYAMHFRRYRKNAIITVLKNAGFELKRSTYFNTLLFPIIALLKILLRIFPKKTALNTEFSLPPTLLNSFLTFFFTLERHILTFFNLPMGVSIALIAQKNVS